MLAAAGVEESRQRVVVEVTPEPQGDEEREANLLRPGCLRDPRAELPLARGGERERSTIACARCAGSDEPSRFEGAKLAVDVARGDVPEPRQPPLDLLQEIPPGAGTVVEEPQQRALGGVQPWHCAFTLAFTLDIPFWRVSL